MICPSCNNRMKSNGTYRKATFSTIRYICKCGAKTTERTEVEEVQIQQARISMTYDDFARRMREFLPRERMPMRILLAHRV